MERIAIDLLWLRPKKVGGTESYIRNLLDGFMELDADFAFLLLVSQDNASTFRKYEQDSRFRLLIADIKSENIVKRIIWQNLFQNRLLKKHGIVKCFEPVYCKPWFNFGIKYTCVIHDLQAYHYPEYHPFHEVAYSRLCWSADAWNADRIIAISNWVREDIQKKYKRQDIKVIYNPILVKKDEVIDFDILRKKYGIEKERFFYTVTQMIPHKNIGTLIETMSKIVYGQYDDLPHILLISGINGNAAEQLKDLVIQKGLENNIVFTGFVSNEERNTLYKWCNAFLFSSVFEGFGMPPLEAMLFGARVVTTQCTAIPEITQGKAIYVENPFDAEEWIEKIKFGQKRDAEVDFTVYDFTGIARQYLEYLYPV